MRQSGDELATDGSILNGFDYRLQCWVVNGIIQTCGSHAHHGNVDAPCCPHRGKWITDVAGHEVR